ncbi:MAG: hypothetical protein V4548_10050 [Bacteroidota bacterium]
MQTFAGFILFFGFYLVYYTSKKATLFLDSTFTKWINTNTKQSKIIGTTLLILSYVLLVLQTALGHGSLLFFIELMAFGSLMILLSPLKMINLKWVIALFIITQYIEFQY